jgi:hypothetical protein
LKKGTETPALLLSAFLSVDWTIIHGVRAEGKESAVTVIAS